MTTTLEDRPVLDGGATRPGPRVDPPRRSETSVATLVTVTLVIVATVLLGGLGAVNYLMESRAVRQRLAAEAATKADQLAAGLALALWNFDRPQTDEVIEMAMRDADVYAVEVRQPDVGAPGRTSVYRRSRGPNWEVLNPGPAFAADGMVVEERAVAASGAQVGTVRMVVSPRFAAAALRRDLVALLVRIVALDAILVWIVFVLLRRTVLRPLRAVEQYAAVVSSGGRGPTDDGGGAMRFHGELARVRESIERMVGLLDARYAALEQSKALTDALIDTVPGVVYLIDPQGKLVRWNSKAEELTGYTADELGARIAGELQTPADRERVRAALVRAVTDGHADVEASLVTKSGARVPYYYTGARVVIDGKNYVVGIGIDISERKRTEAVLLESEKMRTVAGLAAGMAHEINNPLAGMVQNAQVVLNRLRPELPANREAAARAGTSIEAVAAYMRERGIPDMLEAIRQSGRRGAEIVSNMLSFSRKGEAEPAPCDIGELLDAAVELASSDYDVGGVDFRNVLVEREYAPGLPPARCRAAEIQQVVLNLLKNAAQAMAAHPTGRRPRIALRTTLAGDHVRIEVEDDGPGMPETVRQRAFEPFFTTKGPRDGAGLGLFVSYCIVTRNHGGTIAIDSAEGAGTRFTITLPIGGAP